MTKRVAYSEKAKRADDGVRSVFGRYIVKITSELRRRKDDE